MHMMSSLRHSIQLKLFGGVGGGGALKKPPPVWIGFSKLLIALYELESLSGIWQYDY